MENAKLLDSSCKRKVEPKVLTPLCFSTVIKRYIPFMEKRGVFKTYKVETA